MFKSSSAKSYQKKEKEISKNPAKKILIFLKKKQTIRSQAI